VNHEHQEMAKAMMSEWALVISDIQSVVKTYKRYLREYAPNLVATLDEVAATDYFTKVFTKPARHALRK